MSNSDVPLIIRFELEGIRAQMARFIGAHGAELSRHANEAIDKLLQDFNWDACVRGAADNALRVAVTKAIEHHFSPAGPGGREIATAINEIMRKKKARRR